MIRRRALPLAVAALLAAVLAACSEKEEPTTAVQSGNRERVDLMLDYLPNADHAGIYAAIESGEFAKAGLDVRPRTPSDPAAPLKLLQSGRADLAISYEPELLLARAQGAKLVSIGALVQKPLTSIVSLGDDAIRDPAALKDTKVGTAGIPYQDAYLDTILDKANVAHARVKSINVGFNLVPALVSGRVDSVLGMFWNVEGVELRRRGRKPHVLRMEDVGVPTYNELIVVAREDDARSRGPLLRRFMRALARGHADVRDDPAAGVAALRQAEPSLNRKLLRAQVAATVPVFFPEREGRPFGFQEPAQWSAYARWMADNDLITTAQDAGRAFTNEFLPGEGI